MQVTVYLDEASGYLLSTADGTRIDPVTGEAIAESEEEPSENDMELEFYGVKVLVDKEDAPILNGTTIDFKTSLMGGGFSIENPNAIASCGCGSSFKTKTVTGTPENC